MPSAARALDALRIEIEAEHPAAVGLQQLHRDLADQAETDHGDDVAELRRRAAHALQRDRADRRRRGRAQRHAGRNAADQVALHDDPVGVIGLAGARAGDQIAGREIGDAFTDGDHFAGRGIADAPALRVQLARRQPAGQSPALIVHVDRVERQPRLARLPALLMTMVIWRDSPGSKIR